LRFNPLALDIANALVGAKVATVKELHQWLLARGIERVRVVDHEDDLPEVSLLADFAYRRLGTTARRLLTVLCHVTGDHMGADSLFALARVGRSGSAALGELLDWHLVQEPLPARYALHAVVRYALHGRGRMAAGVAVEHYLDLLERHPERFDLEQTHFFAAMDFAHAASNLPMALRIERLFQRLHPDAR
jgi:hypothetical protein